MSENERNEQRIADLEEHVERLEQGILTLTAWLTQVPGCLGQHEYEPLRKIVQGEQAQGEKK